MNHIFSYLDLPQLPDSLEKECIQNTVFIDNDARLNELNKLESIIQIIRIAELHSFDEVNNFCKSSRL